MITRNGDVVAFLEQAIARHIGSESRYQFWFEGKTKFAWHDDCLVVGVPNRFYLEYLEKKFGAAVCAAATDVLGHVVPVRFHIDAELFQADRRSQVEELKPATGKAAVSPPHPANDVEEPSAAMVKPHKRTRRWHRLADFIVGPCNRLAHAAAVSVVELPCQGANPLVIHGPVGTGKTHLLEGVHAGLRKGHPDWRIVSVPAEEFTNRFVQAVRLGKLTNFRKHFRECEVLLVDDLHFLAGKQKTEEEFLHTFDALQAEGKQVVITCDCHPRLADEFSPELADRLLGGAIWGLLPPDDDTRLALLRARSAATEPAVPDDVLRFLASQLRGNVRELEGALCSVRHSARVAEKPMSVEMAKEVLGDLLRHAVRVVALADIDRAVCRVLRLDTGALQSKERAWAVSHPRMLAMFLARKHTRAAHSEIGRHFGGRNHSTVVAAEKKVRRWLTEDGELTLGPQRLRVRQLVDLIERELQR
ncbi:MAG: chromosomal replication initiator protein DnaA [Gemmataceae bacterium]|nr:chromosomal replication initiator protein DnaA [Gemmataceae bacterium]